MTVEPISFSHSSLQVFQSCKLKYEMSRIEGLRRKGNPRGLRRGSAFSDALEHRDPAKIDEMYDALMLDETRQEVIDDLIIERQVIAELYRSHCEYFGDDQQREIEFEFPIEGVPGYVNRGRIDGVNTTGSVKVVEEDKLMQMWGRSNDAALPLDGQVLRYLGAAERLWPDYTIELRYRVTKYPGAYRKNDESPRQYADKVCGQIREKLAKKPHELFVVNVLKLDDPEIRQAVDRYYHDLTLYAQEEAARRKSGHWPAAFGEACKAYGGCEFLPVCKQEPNYQTLYTTREERA